jgi:hypothetical protein
VWCPSIRGMPDSTSNRNSKDRETLGQKIKKLTDRNTILVVTFIVANIITAASAIATAIFAGVNWRNNHFDWQSKEYGRLSKLRAGYTFAKFREQLGQPSYQAPLKPGFAQHSFQRRDYWVDTVTNRSDVVVAYAVTSCSMEFTPTFTLPGNTFVRKVTLNKSTLAGILPNVSPFGADKLRVARPATANRYVFMILYGGNGSNYREYAVGLDDACNWYPNDQDIRDSWSRWFYDNAKGKRVDRWDFSLPKLNKSGRALAAKSLANTYAETMPMAHLSALYKDQIGVDRVAVR